jgi:hypothetical protein
MWTNCDEVAPQELNQRLCESAQRPTAMCLLPQCPRDTSHHNATKPALKRHRVPHSSMLSRMKAPPSSHTQTHENRGWDGHETPLKTNGDHGWLGWYCRWRQLSCNMTTACNQRNKVLVRSAVLNVGVVDAVIGMQSTFGRACHLWHNNTQESHLLRCGIHLEPGITTQSQT